MLAEQKAQATLVMGLLKANASLPTRLREALLMWTISVVMSVILTLFVPLCEDTQLSTYSIPLSPASRSSKISSDPSKAESGMGSGAE